MKEKSLEAVANRIGGVVILGTISNSILYAFLPNLENILGSSGSPITACLIMIVLSIIYFRKAPFKLVIAPKESQNLATSALLILTAFFFGAGKLSSQIAYFLFPFKNIGDIYYGDNIPVYLSGIVLALILEEILFRGVFQKQTEVFGKVFAVITSGIIFGVGHNFFILPKIIAGIFLGVLYLLGGNIGWPILLHFLINFSSNDSEILTSLLPTWSVTQIEGILVLIYLVLTAVMLLICLKMTTLNKWFQKASFKNMKSHFAENKHLYKAYFSSTSIAFYLLFVALNYVALLL